MVAVSHSFVYCHLPCSFHRRPLLGIFQAVQIFHYSRRVCCCLHDSTAISHILTCQGKAEKVRARVFWPADHRHRCYAHTPRSFSSAKGYWQRNPLLGERLDWSKICSPRLWGVRHRCHVTHGLPICCMLADNPPSCFEESLSTSHSEWCWNIFSCDLISRCYHQSDQSYYIIIWYHDWQAERGLSERSGVVWGVCLGICPSSNVHIDHIRHFLSVCGICSSSDWEMFKVLQEDIFLSMVRGPKAKTSLAYCWTEL